MLNGAGKKGGTMQNGAQPPLPLPPPAKGRSKQLPLRTRTSDVLCLAQVAGADGQGQTHTTQESPETSVVQLSSQREIKLLLRTFEYDRQQSPRFQLPRFH